ETLRAIGSTIVALRALEEVCDIHAVRAPTLARLGSGIIVDDYLGVQLADAFDDAGRLSSATYPQLSTLRSAIQSLHEQVRTTLETMVRGDEYSDLLQDKFWTVRDNRYVLPIKSHAKRWDLGIVHDTSGSGRTVFIEPTAVVVLNNKLRIAEGQLAAEEHRILAQLSLAVGAGGDGILDSIDAAVRIDVAVARATLARRLKAVRPTVGTDGVVRLAAARHPVLVLRGLDVVANDLRLDTGRPVLVISGPNAGGKTVALKTVGLCAMLARHGCFVPAAHGSRVDLFTAIDAVIGDQQTIQGDLSSFSAHLLSLGRMVTHAGPGHLLLLDEIASGTDPAQGAALAAALLEQFAEAGARVVVTTHFAQLKARAQVDDRFAIAAMQYVDGRPTYRVLPDTTGESHAFGIARRMGIPEAIVARADALLGEGERRLRETLEALEAEKARAVVAGDEAERLRGDLALERNKLAQREARIAARAKLLEEEGARAYLDRLKKAEKAIAGVVADLQRSPDHKRASAARASVNALKGLVPPKLPSGGGETALSVGDRVRLKGVGQVGEVTEVAGSSATVRVGAMVLKAKIADLQRVTGQAPKPRPRPTAPKVTKAAPTAALDDAVRFPGNTLDLRGQRVEESLEACESFFDRTLMSGRSLVFVLHGHGTGALKSSVRSWLRECAYVDTWAPAHANQGGDAFTVVRLTSA
ncbi:MAG: DNA mismatch repair protein MutS2, partial [Myxococcota bacterium]